MAVDRQELIRIRGASISYLKGYAQGLPVKAEKVGVWYRRFGLGPLSGRLSGRVFRVHGSHLFFMRLKSFPEAPPKLEQRKRPLILLMTCTCCVVVSVIPIYSTQMACLHGHLCRLCTV